MITVHGSQPGGLKLEVWSHFLSVSVPLLYYFFATFTTMHFMQIEV